MTLKEKVRNIEDIKRYLNDLNLNMVSDQVIESDEYELKVELVDMIYDKGVQVSIINKQETFKYSLDILNHWNKDIILYSKIYQFNKDLDKYESLAVINFQSFFDQFLKVVDHFMINNKLIDLIA